MTKSEFIQKLESKLSNFPIDLVNDRICFYSEMIDDYIDNGMTESDAVEKLGSIDEICEIIAEDIPLSSIAKKKLKRNKKLSTLEIILLIVGFPIWFSLLASGLAVVISLYASLVAIVISFWAVVLSCAISSIAGVVLFIIYLCLGNTPLAILMLSAAFILLGITGLFIILSKYLTKFTIKLPKMLFKWVKRLFIIKEVNDGEN